jgi:Tubulin-tyrosine ligase family
LARDAVRAAYIKFDPERRENTFEVFGLDFMIDDQFKVWLIEVNTNPCLETTSPILNRIIPQMVDNVFR